MKPRGNTPFDGLDFDLTVSDAYGVRGLPYGIYLDANGIVRAVNAGQATGAAYSPIWDAAFQGRSLARSRSKSGSSRAFRQLA
jgi:hypothetical protein